MSYIPWSMWEAVTETLDAAASAIHLGRRKVDMWVDDPQLHIRFQMCYRHTGFHEVFLIGIPRLRCRKDIVDPAVAAVIHWFCKNEVPLRRIWDSASSGDRTVVLWESQK